MLANLGNEDDIPALQNSNLSQARSPNNMDIDEGQQQPINIHINNSNNSPSAATQIYSNYALQLFC